MRVRVGSGSIIYADVVRTSCRLAFWARYETRSQAVARMADRTAKNCKGHVT